MNDFKVPEGFEDFVSSAEDLLKQFDISRGSNSAVFHCFCRQASANTLAELKCKIFNTLRDESESYVWNNQPIFVEVACVDGVLCIRGELCFGDNVDDEWFAVYLLLQLSIKYPDLCISINDSDGEFLLIECAELLEDWVDPENSCNRVWLVQGKLVIIPVDEPGALKCGGISLKSALLYLTGNFVCAATSVQRAIAARTTDVYPHRISALEHHASAIVPSWVAMLVKEFPAIVPSAVQAYSALQRDPAASKAVNKLQIRGATADTDAAMQGVALSVRLTRALYALLVYKTSFKVPRRYHSLMRQAQDLRSMRAKHAFDIGSRITCGIESLYYHSTQLRQERGTASEDEFDYLLTRTKPAEHTELRRLWEVNELRFEASLYLDDSAEPRNTLFAALKQQYPQHPVLSQCASLHELMERMIGMEGSGGSDLHPIAAVRDGKLVRNDDDGWLYLTPLEFDLEMSRRMQLAKAADQGSSTEDAAGEQVQSGKGEAASQLSEQRRKVDDPQKLQEMVDGMKAFLKGSSEYDGIASSSSSPGPSARSGKEKKLDGNTSGSPRVTTIAPLTVDLVKLDAALAKLGFAPDGTRVASRAEVSPRDRRQQKSRSDAVCSAGRFTTDPNTAAGRWERESVDSDEVLESDGPRTRDIENDSSDSDEEDDWSADGDSPPARCGQYDEDEGEGVHQFAEDDAENEELLIRQYQVGELRPRAMLSLMSVQELMDAELRKDTRLYEIFEKHVGPQGKKGSAALQGENDDEIDVDFNLLTNLLEAQSHAMGQGEGNPVHHLLAQLGMQLPMPPTVIEKRKKK